MTVQVFTEQVRVRRLDLSDGRSCELCDLPTYSSLTGTRASADRVMFGNAARIGERPEARPLGRSGEVTLRVRSRHI